MVYKYHSVPSGGAAAGEPGLPGCVTPGGGSPSIWQMLAKGLCWWGRHSLSEGGAAGLKVPCSCSALPLPKLCSTDPAPALATEIPTLCPSRLEITFRCIENLCDLAGHLKAPGSALAQGQLASPALSFTPFCGPCKVVQKLTDNSLNFQAAKNHEFATDWTELLQPA